MNLIFNYPITFSYIIEKKSHNVYPANIYRFKVNNRNTRKGCEIFSKLTIKTFSSASIVDFEQENVSWVNKF